MANSKAFNVILSTFTGIGNSLILLFLNLLSRKLFLEYIGLEYLSVAQVINNLLTVFSFAEMGLYNAATFMLYKPLANDNKNTIKKILYLYRKFNRYVAGVVVIIGLLFIPFIPKVIKTNIEYNTVLIIYLLNLLTASASYLYTYRSILLSANQKDYITSLISLIVSFVRIIIQCIVIYVFHDYFIYLSIGIIATFLQNWFIYYKTEKLYPFISNIDVNKNDIEFKIIRKNLIYNVSSMFSVKITGIIINNTSTILISLINTLMVGICTNYTTISGQLKLLMNIFHNALLHSVGVASAEKSDEEKFNLFKRILLLNTFIIGSVSTCLGVLWNDFIVLWIGEEYLLNNFIFISLLIHFSWYLFIAPLWIFRDANGLFKNVKFVLVVNGILNIVFSFILGSYVGIAGVFLGAVFADICTSFWYDSNLVFKKVFKKKNAIFYQIHILENIVTLILMQCLIKIVFISINMDVNIFNWFIKAITATIIYFLWFILRYGKNNVMDNLNYIFRALKYKKYN